MTLVRFNNGINKRSFNPFFDSKWSEDFFRPLFTDHAAHCASPAVNVTETNDAFQLEVAAPGLSKDDFKISLEKDIMKIAVSKEATTTEDQPNYHRREFNFSSFERSFKLPKTVNQEAIQARYDQGILVLTLPKFAEAQDKGAKEIAIS